MSNNMFDNAYEYFWQDYCRNTNKNFGKNASRKLHKNHFNTCTLGTGSFESEVSE